MNLKRIIFSALSLTLLASCSSYVQPQSLSSNSTAPINPLGNASPSLNLFDTPVTTVTPPSQTVTNPATPTSASAVSCMSATSATSGGWIVNGGASVGDPTAQWACLNNQAQAQQGNIGPDSVMAMAISTMGMMNNCSLAVRNQIDAMAASTNASDATAVQNLFQTAQTKLAQCYYGIVSAQANSLQWSPYQASVYNYNAGNIWTLMNNFANGN